MANTKISALTSGNPAQSGDLLPIDRAGANFSITAGSIAALAPAGTVTSVALGADSGAILSVSGSPVTTAGTLQLQFSNESAKFVLAGPTSGGAATPAFRALVATDLPAGTGTVTSFSSGNLATIATTSVATATTTPALTFSLSTQTANFVWAGPTTGAASAPTFRALVAADLPAGTGTVTSVGFTGGLISVATPTTTPALTVAGTSGGIPYFSSASTWATSALLASGGLVLGGGAAAAPLTSTQLTFSAPTLTVGLAGTSSGILSLTGSSSGSATLTAPAVAGTSTNAVVSSNNIQAPAFTSTVAIGTAPLVVTSTTVVGNLNVSQLLGGTWAIPGTIGSTTPNTGGFTTLTSSTSFEAASGTNIGWSGISQMEASVDGVILLTNNAGTGFTRLQFGGTSASFPSIKRTNATLNFRTANDNADIGITASTGVFSSNVTIGLVGTTSGQIVLDGSTSGTCNITGPAVAGTATNPITISNSLQLPSGTVYNWNADTGLSRDSAGVIDIGNGTAGDKSGSINLSTLSASGQITSTVVTGTAPFVVASNTVVANLHAANADLFAGFTWAVPNAIGGTTPNSGAFTTLSASSGLTISSGGAAITGNITGVTGITASGSITAGAALLYTWNGRSKMSSPSDGVISFTNSAATSFTRLNFGGTTSSFVALQASTTTLTVGTADGGTGAGSLTVCGGLTVGVAATTSGVITLAGSTSGTCTITAPATAGTVTNPIAFSNSINLTGSTPVYQANGTSGVSAGSFSAITAIQSTAGLVTTLTGTSDARLKDSVPYEGGLAEILNITPARYRWNAKGQEHTGLSGHRQYVGFIAQDVQAAIPESITSTEPSKDGTETYLSFDDRPIVAALVNAIKQLNARISELESK